MGLYVLFGGVYCLLLIGASLGKSDNRKLNISYCHSIITGYCHSLLVDLKVVGMKSDK